MASQGRGRALIARMRERIAAAEAESAAAAGAAAAPVPPEESSEAEGAAAAVTAPAQLDIPRMSPETPTTTDSGFKESAPAAARGRGRAGLISRLKSIQMGQERPVPVEGIAQPTPEFSTPSPPLFSTSSSGTPAAPVVRRGKEGSPLQCTANYLQLELRQGGGVFEYEVKFNPHVDGIVERRRCVLQHEQIIGKAFNFNGTVLYLPIKLAENLTVVTSETSTGAKVKVAIFFKKQKSTTDPDITTLYNNLFKRIMRILKFCQVNRSYFNPHPSAALMIPEHKLEIWPGYVTAVAEYEGGLQLMCDSAHRVLRSETAYDVLRDVANYAKDKGGDLKTLTEKKLLGTVVLTRYNNRHYRVDDIDFGSNPKASFETSSGQRITFQDYYLRQYNLKVTDDEQPMLVSRPREKSASETEVHKLFYLVPEFCNMTGLTEEMINNFKVMQAVGGHTRLKPEQRQKSMAKFISSVNGTPEAKNVLDGWGLRLADATVQIAGRVLPSETLHFGKGLVERVQPSADWTRTATSKECLTALDLDNWVLIYPVKAKSQSDAFYKAVMQQGPRLGIRVAIPQGKALNNDRTETYLKAIKEAMQQPKAVDVVVTVCPQQRSDRYTAIKKLCYTENPVASQVVMQKTLSNEKKMNAIVMKILLQINAKRGGELWAATTSIKNLMVAGIDVFHDPDNKGCSIAGFVSSLNPSYSKWVSHTCRQRPKQELVDSLRVAFVSGLRKYHHHNGRFPEYVIVFRDGVGDGQLGTVAKHEVSQMKKCFEECNIPQPHPRFVFVVVQKRISTRIYTNPKEGEFGNPPPGSVVDHQVTRRDMYDFFLVSQKVNQGTVSPTHYVVLYDDWEISPDNVQKLTYRLTHMYFNWTGTVRVPAPCQYAHRLAAMVGEHLHKDPCPELEEKLFYL